MPGVILVGLPGVGKSTAGRQVAQKLDRSFHDTDDVLHGRFGLSSADMIRTVGVDVFRHREFEVLRDLVATNDVIATGGGIVTKFDISAAFDGMVEGSISIEGNGTLSTLTV